jgi:hypothetical protein
MPEPLWVARCAGCGAVRAAAWESALSPAELEARLSDWEGWGWEVARVEGPAQLAECWCRELRGRLERAAAVAEAAAAFVAAAASVSETPTGTFSEWGAKLAARREALEGLRAAVARWEAEKGG